MHLGPYRLAGRHLLAPMAGVSQAPFRRLVLELGAALAPTELISAEGLIRGNARTADYLRHDPERERPFYVQLFGGDPERMARAAEVAARAGAGLLDLNMGCPVPKVTRNGAGAALMGDPERAAAMVRAVAAASGLPVTAKIRSGWDAGQQNAVPFALRLEEAGVVAVAVHGRTRAQGYAGRADWGVIAAVKRALSVPVIGNGDVASAADAERMRAETGCDGVMVGRAALGNPWIFRQLEGGPGPTRAERQQMVLRHLAAHLELFEDPGSGVRAFRNTLLWYTRGVKGAAAFRSRAVALDEPEAVREAVRAFFGTAELDPAGRPDPAPPFG